MRTGNLANRLVVFSGTGVIDVEEASGGQFESDPQGIFARWSEFLQWVEGASLGQPKPYNRDELGAPAPRPSQIFAIGLNYGDHAQESGFGVQNRPTVFTKFPSSIGGPYGEIDLPPGSVDWEVELVAVVSEQSRMTSADEAWGSVAGLTIGQDISEREMQLEGTAPQFSLAKSFPGFSPMGPCLVTIDEFSNPDDLELGCTVNGEEVQKSRTSFLLASVPMLISYLSSVVTLQPGDLIFTGTPAGVGSSRTPPRFLKVGDVLDSTIEGIGQMSHRFVGP